MKESISKYINELDALIEKLWEEAPDEIYILNEPTYFPGYTRYIRITSASRLLSSVAGMIGTMKSCLNKGVSLDIVKSLTEESLKDSIIFIEAVEFFFTSKLLKKFLELLPDIEDKESYLGVTERLAFYCKRVGPNGWIDTLYLHKAQMSMAYDQLFPPKI